MSARQNHFRNTLRWLEMFLWIAGCCALGYCALVTVDASITQGRSARSLKQARERESHNATADARGANAARNKTGSIATGLVGRLDIPSIGLSSIVLEGVGSRTLRVGAGHVPGTPEPGQTGNVVMAGHRDTFFRPLQRIRVNDEISLDTGSQNFHYRVSSTEIVDPHDVALLRSHYKNELTLITCYPFYYVGPAPKRFIVHADLVSSSRRWLQP
jgi:sortase A